MNYYNDVMFFSFILMRMSGFIFLNPIFARRNVPGIIRSGIVIALSIIIFSTIKEQSIVVLNLFEYGFLLVKEFIAGYVIGFIISLFSYVIIFAGEIIDLQLGLSMAKIFDAQSDTSISLSATYYNILYMLLFFVTDAHVALINILINSSKLIPYGQIIIGQDVAKEVLHIFVLCSALAVKMAFPIIEIQFLCTVAMGILMKAIPQINVFVVDIQLKIFVGLFLIILIFSPMSDFLNQLITTMIDSISNILYLMI